MKDKTSYHILLLIFVSLVYFFSPSSVATAQSTPGYGEQDFIGGMLFDDDIQVNATSSVLDTWCPNPNIGNCSSIVNCRYLGYAELFIPKLNNPSQNLSSGVYNLSVAYEYTYILPGGGMSAPMNDVLSIQFNKDGGIFVNHDRNYIDGGGGYLINSTIQSVTFTDPSGSNLTSADIPEGVVFQLGITTERYQTLNPNTNGAQLAFVPPLDEK